MKQETTEKMHDLVNTLTSEHEMLEVTGNISHIEDPISEVAIATLLFIQARFNKIQDDVELEKAIMNKFTEKVNNDEMSIDNMITILNQTKLRNTEAVESLLTFFRNGENGVNKFFDKPTEGEGNGLIPENLDPSSMRAIEKLIRAISESNKEDKE